MPIDQSNFLVIGAGISGLLIARQLHDAGRSVRVLEKGRGFGGRMATRRLENARFDHGAQYFTVRDARFQTWVDRWLAAGIIREWFGNFGGDEESEGHPRYIGVNGMSDVGKWLGDGLEVFRGTRVRELHRRSSEWSVLTESGSVYTAAQLIVTAPVPQALELLDGSGIVFSAETGNALRAVRYAKGFAVMAQLDGPSGLPDFGGVKVIGGPLVWLADNQRKGISETPAITLHSDPAFAETHWQSPDEVGGSLLIEKARRYLKANVTTFTCHRWGYALPTQTYGARFFHHPASGLWLAGDGFGGPRVEGAVLSAIEAGQRLLS